MNSRQFRQFHSIDNCVAIVRDPMYRRPEIDALRVKLEKSVQEVRRAYNDQHAADMLTGADGAALAGLRQQALEQMRRISRHAVVFLKGLPGISEDVRVPRSDAKDAELLDAVKRITQNLRPHMKTMRKTGLPGDAMSRLAATAKSLEAKSGQANTAIARRARATAALPDAIRDARAVAAALDSAIRAEFPSDHQAVVQWAGVYRIPARMGRPKKRPPPKQKPDDPQ